MVDWRNIKNCYLLGKKKKLNDFVECEVSHLLFYIDVHVYAKTRILITIQ